MDPMRAIVEPLVATVRSGEERGDGKDPILLGLGDPTVYIPPCKVALESIQKAIESRSPPTGQVNPCGTLEARQAIARFHSSPCCGVQVQPDHVIVTSGCSGALELVLSTLLDNNDHHPRILLVPQPGCPLYQVIAESHGAIVMHYRLLPDKNWETDLNHVRELVKQRGTLIRGMIVNNPSNPTRVVYTADHLFAIIRMADECRLPIVADEEYGDLTFGMHRLFHPLAVMAGRAGHRVPVITCSGLAKQYLLPGWRMGWAVFHDNHFQSLREIHAGAKRLAQVGGTGASHLVQSVVSALLEHADDSTSGEGGNAVRVWKQDLVQSLSVQEQKVKVKQRG